MRPTRSIHLSLCIGIVLLLVMAMVLPAAAAPRAAGSNIAAGSILVRSIPGEAAVTLDGAYQGVTPQGNNPLIIENVDAGPHQLVLSKRGYLDTHHQFWIGSGQRSEIRLTLTATTGDAGSVSLISSPSGADVQLDGEYRGRTPLTISGLTSGQHQLVLDLPGYTRYSSSVEVQNGVMTYLDPVLTRAAAVGYISIISNPAGAFVYIDGTYRGVTPLVVSASTGLRQVELDHSGYADWSSWIQVASGTTVYMNADLQRLSTSSTGGIAVSSIPTGAQVYLDDAYRGVTPGYGDLELTDVSAGSHTVMLRLDGYQEYRITVQVSSDATVKVQPRLVATGNPGVTATPTTITNRGAIESNSTPTGARVSVDGLYKGTTPFMITDVPAGPHTLVFTLAGYVEREQAVEVRAGQTATANANLTPVQSQTRSGMPPVAVVLVLGAALVGGAVLAGRRR